MITPTIGELNELIDILEVGPPFSVTGAGTVISTFRSNVWAKIVPLGGADISDTQQTQAYTQHYNVWIRTISGITAFQQFDWTGTRLTQTAPAEAIGRSWLLLHVEEKMVRSI